MAQRGPAGRLRRRRRRPRRLDLRGPRLRPRRGREPRRRLHREGDARRAPLRAAASCCGAPRSTRTRPTSGATARRASSTTSTSTTRARTSGWPPMTEFDALSKREGFEPGLGGRWRPGLRESALFDRNAIHEIHRMAREGIYDIRGFGAKRRVPHFDDLLFLGASVSRYPLEGYREQCATDVTLGTRFAKEPVQLEIPITIAGMSFGALSAPAKEALGRGATAMGTRTTTGDGGMLPEEREHSEQLVYQILPSPLRDEPRRPAPRRRDRGRGRPGREAGRRGDAARPEDLRPGRRDARPAEGRRPAQRLPPSRLDRARRPRDQDRRAARDHRLAQARST